jgi:hypothetical protein
MCGRWYTISVLLFWLLTMSWLISRKVLPPLLVGEPPSPQKIVAARRREPPVGWHIYLSDLRGGSSLDRRLGWAISSLRASPDGGAVLCGRLHLDDLPLAQMVPGWLHGVLKLVDQPVGSLKMEIVSTAAIGPQGRLSHFESSVRIGPLREAIRLTGTVDGTRLALSVRSGDFTYRSEPYLPADALLGDSLSPQTQMPGLHLGQRWTVPSYSPLRPPNNPLEILQATVETNESLVWNNVTEDTLLVIYRSDSGFTFGRSPPPRGKMWVLPDGTVLQQEVTFLDSRLTFQRMTKERAEELAKSNTEGR